MEPTNSAASVGIVPTMGSIHAAHEKLVSVARIHSDIVVATIFVNPKQFSEDEDFDKYPKEAFGYIFASRGCPYACTFCESKSMWTRKVRYRSPENIVAELKQMQEFGINKVNFDDATFGISKKNIKAIISIIKK